MLPALRSLQPSRNFIVQITSAGALAITGDVVCQLAIEKAEKLDVRRSLRFGILIGCVIAPIQYRWFKFLESRVQSKTVLGTGVKRMLFDQVLAAPVLTSGCVFALNLLNSHSIDYAAMRTRASIVPILSTNYKVWPAVQIFNQAVLPFKYRVIFVQFVALFWNAYLSYMTAKSN